MDMTPEQAAAALEQVRHSVHPHALDAVQEAAAQPVAAADQAIVDLLNTVAAGAPEGTPDNQMPPTFEAAALAARLAYNTVAPFTPSHLTDPHKLAEHAHAVASQDVPDDRPVHHEMFLRVTGADPALPADEAEAFETVRHTVLLVAAVLEGPVDRAAWQNAYGEMAARLQASVAAADNHAADTAATATEADSTDR